MEGNILKQEELYTYAKARIMLFSKCEYIQ